MGLSLFKRRRKDALLLDDDGRGGAGDGDGDNARQQQQPPPQRFLAILQTAGAGPDDKASDDRTARTSAGGSSGAGRSPARAGDGAGGDAAVAWSGGLAPTGAEAVAEDGSAPAHDEMSPVNVSDITSSSTVVAASTTLELGDSQLVGRSSADRAQARAPAPVAASTPAPSPTAPAGGGSGKKRSDRANETPSPNAAAAAADDTPKQTNVLSARHFSLYSSSARSIKQRSPSYSAPPMPPTSYEDFGTSITLLDTSQVDGMLAGRSDEMADVTNSLLETTGSTAGWTEPLNVSLNTIDKSLNTSRVSRRSGKSSKKSPGKGGSSAKKESARGKGGSIRHLRPPRRDTRSINFPPQPPPAGAPPRPSPENSVDLGVLPNINMVMGGDDTDGDGCGVEMELTSPPTVVGADGTEGSSPGKSRRNLSSLFDEEGMKIDRARRGPAAGRAGADKTDQSMVEAPLKALDTSFETVKAEKSPAKQKKRTPSKQKSGRKTPSKQRGTPKQKSAKKSSGENEGNAGFVAAETRRKSTPPKQKKAPSKHRSAKKSPGGNDEKNGAAAADSPEKRSQRNLLKLWRKSKSKPAGGSLGSVPVLIDRHRDDVSLLTVPEVRGGAPGSVRSGDATDAGVRGSSKAGAVAKVAAPGGSGAPSFAPPVAGGALPTVDEASAESSRLTTTARSAAVVSPGASEFANDFTAADIMADIDDIDSGMGSGVGSGTYGTGGTTTQFTGPSTTAAMHGGIDRLLGLLGLLSCGAVDGGAVADAVDDVLRCVSRFSWTFFFPSVPLDVVRVHRRESISASLNPIIRSRFFFPLALRCDNVCGPADDFCGPGPRVRGAIETTLEGEERLVTAFQSVSFYLRSVAAFRPGSQNGVREKYFPLTRNLTSASLSLGRDRGSSTRASSSSTTSPPRGRRRTRTGSSRP